MLWCPYLTCNFKPTSLAHKMLPLMNAKLNDIELEREKGFNRQQSMCSNGGAAAGATG